MKISDFVWIVNSWIKTHRWVRVPGRPLVHQELAHGLLALDSGEVQEGDAGARDSRPVVVILEGARVVGQ